MEFPLLFALLMVVVAATMIWGARKRHRQARPAARQAKVREGHDSIEPIDVAPADLASSRLSGRARSSGDGIDGPDGGGASEDAD